MIFSAPSGAGKTTIVKELLKKKLNLHFSISACSREPRKNEIHGKDYYFLSPEEFKAKIQANAFIEWEEVYENYYYGTLKSEVERLTKENKNVIFDVDVAGGLEIKKQYKNKSLAVFIMPPSVEELEKRLKSRNLDSPENIKKRIEKARYEITFAKNFDEIIINDNLNIAVVQIYNKVKTFLKHP